MKALSHPLRVRMLTLLNQKVSSPSELADELGEPLGNVSYHMRFLADLKMVKLVRTEPRRGAVEHYYQALEPPQVSGDDWAQLPASLRRTLSDGVLGEKPPETHRQRLVVIVFADEHDAAVEEIYRQLIAKAAKTAPAKAKKTVRTQEA